MKPWYQASEVVQAANWQRAQIAEEIGRADSFHQWHQKQRGEIEAQLGEASRDLGQSLLPTLEPAAIARAVGLTGYAPLTHENIPARVEAERVDLRHKIAAIEADRRFAQRELLRHPRVGSLPRTLRELSEYRKPWADFMQACSHPRLARLIQSGWGTPQYTGAWWRLSYYSDRSAAAEILARFPGKKEFGEIAADWARAVETVAKLDAEIAKTQHEITTGERMEAEHARLGEALASVDARWLAWARDRVLRHCATSDPNLIAQWLDREPAMKLLFLRASGLSHKLGYLDALFQEKVGKTVQALREQDARYAKMVQRYQRKPAPMPGAQFAKSFPDRREKWHKGWQKYAKAYDRVKGFDKWKLAGAAVGVAGVAGAGLLWWDLMTDGREAGDFLPDVVDFRRRHPGYRYSRPVVVHHHHHEHHDHGDDYDDGAGAAVAVADNEGAEDRDEGRDPS